MKMIKPKVVQSLLDGGRVRPDTCGGAAGARVRPRPRAVGPRRGATAGTVRVRRRDADGGRARVGTRTCAYDQARPAGAVLQPCRATSWMHACQTAGGHDARRGETCLRTVALQLLRPWPLQ